MRNFFASVFVLMIAAADAQAEQPLDAAGIVAACKAERLSLSDRDHGGKPAPDKPASASGPDICKSFLIDYFKTAMAPPVASEPKVCVRLPDFVAFRALADVLIEAAGDRDLKGVSAKQLADQAFSARYPCQSR
jgi:hypothetical protein